MRKKLNIICFFLLASFVFGQKKKKNKTYPPQITKENICHSPEATKNKNYQPISLNNRIKKYPFSKAYKIKIISFNLDFASEVPSPPPPPNLDSAGIANYYKDNPNPISLEKEISNKSENKFTQSKSLALPEISELSNILYNTCNQYNFGFVTTRGCYFPRNAILFYDENDSVFAYIEICFQCMGIKTSENSILNNDEICDYIYPKLESFFNKMKLKTQYLIEEEE